jgi:hypothetical protein
MKTATTQLAQAAIIGLLLTLPFVALELTFNSSQSDQGVVVLFVFIWGLLTTLTALATSLVRTIRAGRSVLSPMNLALKLPLLSLIAVIVITLIADQLPCFLGIPNCD